MNAEELRIGNWIKSPIESGGNVERVIRIETDSDGYSHYLDHCLPIPLTEEWLEKLGVNKVFEADSYLENVVRVEVNSHSANKYYYVIDSFANDMGDWWYCETEIEYVHELQNLKIDLKIN